MVTHFPCRFMKHSAAARARIPASRRSRAHSMWVSAATGPRISRAASLSRAITSRPSAQRQSSGRPLSSADDAPTASPAIVLDYGYWQRAFGADPSAVSRTVRLNNVDVAIVGVAEPGFTSLTPGKSQDFFMPLSLAKRVQSERWGMQGRL